MMVSAAWLFLLLLSSAAVELCGASMPTCQPGDAGCVPPSPTTVDVVGISPIEVSVDGFWKKLWNGLLGREVTYYVGLEASGVQPGFYEYPACAFDEHGLATYCYENAPSPPPPPPVVSGDNGIQVRDVSSDYIVEMAPVGAMNVTCQYGGPSYYDSNGRLINCTNGTGEPLVAVTASTPLTSTCTGATCNVALAPVGAVSVACQYGGPSYYDSNGRLINCTNGTQPIASLYSIDNNVLPIQSGSSYGLELNPAWFSFLYLNDGIGDVGWTGSIGFQAGQNSSPSNGSYQAYWNNVNVGYQAGANATTSSYSTVNIGQGAGLLNGGHTSVNIGAFAGEGSSAFGNVNLGYQANYYSTSNQSISIGYQAGQNQMGLGLNINIGCQTATSASGTNQINIGNNAGGGSGNWNLNMGYESGGGSGSYQVNMGYQAGGGSGNYQINLGYGAGDNAFNYCFAAGRGSQCTAANQFALGSSSQPLNYLSPGAWGCQGCSAVPTHTTAGDYTATRFWQGITPIQVVDTITCIGAICTKTNNAYAITVNGMPVSTPASSSAACTAGQMSFDSAFIYTCVATNTWRRIATLSF